MTETEFIEHSEALFDHIEDALDDYDFDTTRAGNVLNVEASDGTQIVINRHTPNQELWIAAKSGGYHFAEHNGKWLATRDGRDFFDVLNEVLGAAAGETVAVPRFDA